MKILLWSTIIFGLFIVKQSYAEKIIRIENGRKLFHIKNREPFMGNYIQLVFASLHCISSLIIDSLSALTGAEEIELIYKICENDSNWYLTHYSNIGDNFTLYTPIYATFIAVITQRPINIIDVNIESCRNNDFKRIIIKNFYKNCQHLKNEILYKHRKHHNRRFLFLEKLKRLKRNINNEMIIEFTAKNSPYHILRNITVHVKQILKIYPGTVMKFSHNTGIIAYGILQIIGTKYNPIILHAINDTWNGLYIKFAKANVGAQSQLKYLNVSGSKSGIWIESLLLPQIENIISDSNDNGLTIFAPNNAENFNGYIFNQTIKNVTTINNRKNGIVVHVRAKEPDYLILEQIVTASNHFYGLLIDGKIDVIIRSSQFFANNKDGVSIHITNGSTLEVHNSIFDSNGQYGLQINTGQQIQVKCFSSNFTDHNSKEAILVNFVSKIDFLFDGCLWRNNDGGVTFRNITDSNLHLLNGNWTGNRGTSILADEIKGKTNITIENNDFRQNIFRINSTLNSVIELGITESDKETHVRINDNRFFRNVMDIILLIDQSDQRNMPTNGEVIIAQNSFIENLALNTVYLTGNHVNIAYNTFNNSEAQCELYLEQKGTLASIINATNNYWGTTNQEEVMSRICDYRNDKSLMTIVALPFLNVAPQKLSTNITEQRSGSSSLKLFASSMIIGKDEIAIFHAGSMLYFKPNHGIIVYGILHLLGQQDNPILLKSSNNEPWLGIILNEGGIIYANHCILENAEVGLNVSSSNISIRSVRIIRPIITGVLIAPIYNGTFDMGESIILQSRKNAIQILKRQIHDTVLIRNVQIIDCAETGIDFVKPAGNIILQNIVLENTGSFGIFIAQRENDEKLDSIILSNLTIRKQEQGNGGILLNLMSYSSLQLNSSNFISNVLPSVIVCSKCPLGREKRTTPKMIIEKNHFLNNENLVIRVTLEGCEDVKVHRNIFIRNNNDGHYGTFLIHVSSQEDVQPGPIVDIAQNKFVENNGQWSLHASATNINQFYGAIHSNYFNMNQNYHKLLIATSPNFHVNNNNFEPVDLDTKNTYKKEHISTIDERKYCTNDLHNMGENVLDLKDETEINAISRKRAAVDCSAVSDCSKNGRCIGLNICHCNVGFNGPDCAQISCSALKNCSRNGYCIGPNVCKCFDGWQRDDCSEPTCHLVNNCTNHGTCVSLNECECEPIFKGSDCSEPVENCSRIGCNNHGSCSNNKCVCETGWTGTFCSKALCDQLNSCSGSGKCIRPQMCECFRGFTGNDCSICEGSTCDLCNGKCIHGRCNPDTRTCICHGGWTGLNCDLCTIDKCDIMSMVLYVVPTATGINPKKEENILVHGSDLPFVPSKRYTCLYGNIASDGFYVSSSLVRCTVPRSALPGRYLFNIIPYGFDKAIPFLDKRLIHFTFYNECNQAECKGYCVGATCLCPIDQDGAYCEQRKIPLKMDHEILNNEKLTVAIEGEPYTVKIPLQQDDVIFNVETDANGMTIYPNGLIYWALPIGRIQPYTVNVTAISPTGGFTISWNLTVIPMYTPIITKVENAGDSNKKIINGIVNFRTKPIGKVPIKMLVYQDGKQVDDVTSISTIDGHFKFEYYPFDETISTTVIAVHPGAAKPDAVTSSNNVTWTPRIFDIEYAPKIKMKPGEQIDQNYRIKSTGEEELLNCHLELIGPRDKIQIMKYEKVVKGIGRGESKSMKVTFATTSTLDNTTLILQFNCIETSKKLIRQQIEVERERPMFESYPSEMFISISPQIPPKIITVDIINKKGYKFVASPKISIQPDHSPLFLISTKPSLQNITEFSNPESTLTLFLSYKPLATKNLNWTTSGDLILFDGKKQLFTIKYRNYATSDIFDLRITVMDELSASDPTHFVADAEIILRNDIYGYVDNRRTKSNPVVFFSIIERTYQLTVQSPTHVSVTMIIQPSFINSSFTVFTPINSPFSPSVEDGRLSIEEINERQKIPLPKLHFTPSTILVPLNGSEEVKLLISSDSDGPSDHVAILPSIEIRDEHLPFVFATADVRNGLGPGDGYYMKFRLSSVSNQAATTTQCTVFAIQIPYIYMVPSSTSNCARNVMILADNRNEKNDKVHLCEVGLQTASKQASIWTKTTIYCNCAMKMKENCRKYYVSVAVCGNAWKYIPDDTVSLQTTAMFIALIADCHTAGINLHKITEFLTCAASLNSNCPGTVQQQPFNNNRSTWRSQQRKQFFNQLAVVKKQAYETVQKHFTVLKTTESQTIDIIDLYTAFFERLNILLPFKYFEVIRDKQWFNKFFGSISESSEDGLIISKTEFEKLEDEEGGAILAHRWNSTIAEWSTTLNFPSNAKFIGMKFTDARELIISSDRLKALTKQYGASNPFALLHDYMRRLLSWPSENISVSQQTLTPGNNYEENCAYAYTLITPEKPYENSEFYVMLKVTNKKNEALESLKLTIEMIPSDADTMAMQFRVGSVLLDGIGSIDGTSKLLPNSSFIAKWSLKPIKNMRLIHEIEYQAILILKFTQNGYRSIQRIATQTVIFRPRPSLKVYYFISNFSDPEIMNNTSSMFNVMIAFMNTGYSNLTNVKVEEIRISVVSENNHKIFLPYQISEIINSNDIEDNVLSGLHFTIANIESGKTINVMYKISTGSGQRGVIGNFKTTTSINGELVELEDTQTFIIQQFISPIKFLVSLQTNTASLFYYDMQKAVLRTTLPLIFISVKEKVGSSDGKPFRQQFASFQLNKSQQKQQQQRTSFYGQIPYPVDLESDFEVLLVNQVGKNGALKLVDPRYIWYSNTDPKCVHFIDDNPPSGITEFIVYEIIYGNMEQFLRPRFEFPVYNIPIVNKNWPHAGDQIARIQAVSANQSAIHYELYSNSTEMNDYFSINPETGVINLKKEITPTKMKNNFCATVRAIDEYGRSEVTTVIIEFDGFSRGSPKINNFDSLKPLTFHPPQSDTTTAVTEIGLTRKDSTKRTSEISEVYILQHTKSATSFPSTVSSITAKIDNKEDGKRYHQLTTLTARKHEYTKLIATQSVLDFNASSDLTSENDSNGILYFDGFGSTKVISTTCSTITSVSVSTEIGSNSTLFSGGFGSIGSPTDSTITSVSFSTAETWSNDGFHNDQAEIILPYGGTYYRQTTLTSQITDSSEQYGSKEFNIQLTTEISVTPTTSSEISIDFEDRENIVKKACKLKNTQPIWSLICDLSKILEIKTN